MQTTLDRDKIEQAFRDVQDTICSMVGEANNEKYTSDIWHYDKGTGGGDSRWWYNSKVIESGGVNFSAIAADSLPSAALAAGAPDESFFATGVSLVLHPRNPQIPTIHLNIRYFETPSAAWFGGGVDLTPFCRNDAMVIDFHKQLANSVNAVQSGVYTDGKTKCDSYFTLPHREQMRGVGGVFYDHLPPTQQNFDLVLAIGNGFNDLYRPWIEANHDKEYTDAQEQFQLWRRGRYVEFNLLWDRGTKFGIESGGRAESILMSMPPRARWQPGYAPAINSEQSFLQQHYYQPQNWQEGQPTFV